MAEIGSIRRPYAECRQEIFDGDVAIWAPEFRRLGAKLWHFLRRPLHFGIQDATASRFIHAAMFGWCYGEGWHCGRLLLAEFTQKKGGVLTLASSQIRGESGNWHVLRPRRLVPPSGRRDQAAFRREAFTAMVDLTGTPYSMAAIRANLLRSLPILRWFVGRRVDENDATSWGAATCSASVCRALRMVGLNPYSGESWSDPVPHKADYLCSPADLVRSTMLEYQFTILE